MCRFFAVRATTPIALAQPLLDAPAALVAQSKCDCRGEAHGDGWGVASIVGGQWDIRRSTRPAHEDPKFRALARSLSTTLAIAHVRQASVGQVSLENTHPFQYGRWVFAHNGTLQNFAAGRSQLLAAIPDDLQASIAGTTDSEHIFYMLLGKLRSRAGSLESAVTADHVATGIKQTVHLLNQWFPTHNGEETRLNFLLSNGRLLAATCWKHTLHVLENASSQPAVMIASEPTDEGPWQPVSQRSLLLVDEKLQVYRRISNDE